MNPDQHPNDEALDLLALGAAGALSDDEYTELDALLAADPELAREYADLQASAATLAEASSVAPPPHLRASILDAIRDVDQLPGHEVTAGTGDAATEPYDVAEPDTAVVIPPGPDHRPSRSLPANVVPIHHRRWMVPATVAAAVLMLLVGGLIVRDVADAPADRMADVLNDDDAVTIQLDGALAGLRLVASDDEGAAVLMGSDLARPETGMVFQLWAIHDDESVVGMGTFMPTATGEVAMVIEGVDDEPEWAVTVEPDGGSDQPTSDPIAVSPGRT